MKSDVSGVLLVAGCLFLILQPLFADGQALHADAEQAGAWAMLYRCGSIGVAGLWTGCLLMPRRVVRRLPDVAAVVMMGCVIWEAWVALNQLYGEEMSNHALYRFTGTFLNPGPFCGFMAIGVPLAVHCLLVDKGRVDKLTRVMRHYDNPSLTCQLVNLSTKSTSLIALLTLILCLLLLPAGMSRSAWVAAAVGAGTVYGMHRWTVVREWCGTLLQRRRRIMAAGGALVLCIGVGWGIFHLKEDSANGRLFMWKVTCHAIAERPWTGYGTEGFPMAYAEAQEHYFASGKGSEKERYVAGTPDNAFNEYLTITVKYGLTGLGVMLVIGITALVCAIRQQSYGIAGALVTVAVFAFSSYPLQLPDFLAVVILLVAAPVVQVLSISSKGREEKSEASGMPLRRSLAVVSLAALVPLLYWGMRRADIWQARHDAAKEWRNVRTLYHMEAYSVVCEDYAPLYERMRWNHNYLFEYGRALHQTKKHEESNRILEEAEQLCGDPMILNIQGKNHEAMGEFDHAALLYQRAYHRLPNRLYPLYLEMLMYASQVCNQPEGAKDLAKRILDTKEKIPSKAVEEMKMKAKEILTHPLN